jgi:hypothetical protein
MRIRKEIQAVLWQPHTALAYPLSGRNSTYRSDFTSHYYLPRPVPEADLVIMRRLKAAGFCFKTFRAISAFGNAGCRYDNEYNVPLSQKDRNLVEAIRREERYRRCP